MVVVGLPPRPLESIDPAEQREMRYQWILIGNFKVISEVISRSTTIVA